jgi:hypothetical protein
VANQLPFLLLLVANLLSFLLFLMANQLPFDFILLANLLTFLLFLVAKLIHLPIMRAANLRFSFHLVANCCPASSS